nr:putative IgA-specific serine endopeptidase [Serratia symbiotica]
MRHDIEVQDYRDFGENLGKYSVGSMHIPVYKKDGSLSGYLDFPMPDFGMVVTTGISTLVAPSYIASVRHNTGYKTVSFGNGAQYATSYKLINRNNSTDSDIDFHLPRLSKVVTDAVPIEAVNKSEIRKGNTSRYSWYARVGGGRQSQVNDDQTGRIVLSDAYKWVSGGTINTAAVTFPSGTLRAPDYGPDSPLTSPLSIGSMAGDSGSPIIVYDEVDKRWKIAGVLHAGTNTDAYNSLTFWEYIPDGYIQGITTANTTPEVTDTVDDGVLIWGQDAITQNGSAWSWEGLSSAYNRQAPSVATDEELDATKDLHFNGTGGVIELSAPINLGAGKLQFSNNYTLKSAGGAEATWAGGGVDVDAGKEVLWQVNGLSEDALHKIGEGTLHVNAKGINPGSLNVGAGTVVLDQQADAAGHKQAFSSVTLVSGRPTVVLNDADQVATSNINFGYRGGMLDLNGNALNFKMINHTDSGATLVNHNGHEVANLAITGFTPEDVPFNRWDGNNNKGTPGSIYVYDNPYTKDTEYFQLNTSSYGYFPTNKSSTSTWTYLGTDPDAAVEYRLTQLDQQVFRGFLGETDESKNNGKMNVTIRTVRNTALTDLTGGMNIAGNLNVGSGTVLLSGRPIAHAGGKVIEDDWSTSLFRANQIRVDKEGVFQVGEYASVTADIIADESARLSLGYNDSKQADEKSWRCYSVIYRNNVTCSQPIRDTEALALLPASTVTGDIQLASNASLYLGKVRYQGTVASSGSSSMTLDPNAYWEMMGNSNVSSLRAESGALLSMVPMGRWSAKTLEIDSLDASGLTISMGIKPSMAENDRLLIKKSATGSSNLLDMALMVDAGQQVILKQDLVIVDAPVGTTHDYFTFASTFSGFSIYTPKYQVKDESDRVLWILEKNNENELDKEPTFNPDKWFTVQDNQPLIQSTRAMMASRQYIFSEALTQLYDRSNLLRIAPQNNGEWVTVEHSKGRFFDLSTNQQTLNVGWDEKSDMQIFGISASYTQGQVKGNGKENHHLATAGVYYSWQPREGWFVDTASHYMYLNQELTLDPMLGVNGATRDTHILAGSARTGYQFSLADDTLLISPYIGVSVGVLSGYSLKGNDVVVSLSSATPYYGTNGILVQKKGLWQGYKNITLTAGIEYQYSPEGNGSRITLSDHRANHQYAPWFDNRYNTHLGIEGSLNRNLSASVKVKNSFGRTFKTDYSGIIGINYRF